MGRDLTNGIERAYSKRLDLLVIALTGRTGSGCTTTATALGQEINALPTSATGLVDAEKRKHQICADFAKAQWVPFKSISVSTVILSFLIQEEWSAIEAFLKAQKAGQNLQEIQTQYNALRSDPKFPAFEALATHHDTTGSIAAWEFYAEDLKRAASRVKAALGKTYASVFQTLGDNIRKSGRSLKDEIDPGQIFMLITRVKRLAKAARIWDQANHRASTRIVIDAIRNPLELVYLRDQFASFFAMAITTDDEDRKDRLAERMSKAEISAIDAREYSKKSLRNYDNFVSQNLEECIQKSDIFIHNPGRLAAYEQKKFFLHNQLVRYVTLMARPGLITPTHDERCMQLAFVAKLNSGCISRQVGAAISDANSSIKAVGWNDVPKGQIPCLLRDVNALLNSNDTLAFSDYELTNVPLRTHLSKKFQNAPLMKTARGLHCPYCFKDAYNETVNKGSKDAVHTRSLHAEENAFLQLAKYGNSGIAGGHLYTTASPCELCSKKALQLGIVEIVYVDPYPGISSSHVLSSGRDDLRPTVRLFSGAIGNAYHRLYDPILPIKDEYMARLSDDPDHTLL